MFLKLNGTHIQTEGDNVSFGERLEATGLDDIKSRKGFRGYISHAFILELD